MVPNHAVLMLRVALAFVWVWTGIVCLAVAPIEDSVALMDRVGIHGTAARWTVWVTSGFEIVLGVVVAAGWFPRLVAAVQLTLIGGFTLIITAFLPEWWLHPFGPISKNIVLLAAAYAVARLDETPTRAVASPERT